MCTWETITQHILQCTLRHLLCHRPISRCGFLASTKYALKRPIGLEIWHTALTKAFFLYIYIYIYIFICCLCLFNVRGQWRADRKALGGERGAGSALCTNRCTNHKSIGADKSQVLNTFFFYCTSLFFIDPWTWQILCHQPTSCHVSLPPQKMC